MRVFSGRTARVIRNRMHDEYGSRASRAYLEVHHLTSPLRAHGRAVGAQDPINLWGGQAHRMATAGPAEEITGRVAGDAREAIATRAGWLR